MSSEDLMARISMREEILHRLRHVVIERLDLRRAPDELDADAPLFGSGFGLDSLDAVELVVCLESDFGFRISDGGLLRQSIRTLNTLTDAILAHRGVAI